MKKILYLCIVILFLFVSCNLKKKTGLDVFNDSIGELPEPPPLEFNLSQNEVNIFKELEKIVEDADASGNWDDIESKYNPITDPNHFSKGFLITRSIGNGNEWYVLGVTCKKNLSLGVSANLYKAIEMASKKENFDPRKFIYSLGTNATSANSDKGIRITWSGRVGVKNYGYKYNDKYQNAITVFGRVLGVTRTYRLLNPLETIKFSSYSNWENIKKHEYYGHSDTAQFEYEIRTDNNQPRAWLWGNPMDSSDASVVYPNQVRFGYGPINDNPDNLKYILFSPSNNLTGYPMANYSAGNIQLTDINAFNIGDKNEMIDTKAPIGKTVLIRNSTPFLTTVIAYNIRSQTNTNSIFTNSISTNDTNSIFTSTNIIPTRMENVIMEFDASSFYDAQNDGWTTIYDIPTRSSPTPEIGDINGSDTYKINFMFLKFK